MTTPPPPVVTPQDGEGATERHIHAWTDDDGKFQVVIDPHGGPCLYPDRMPASTPAVADVRVEWGVRWLTGAVQGPVPEEAARAMVDPSYSFTLGHVIRRKITTYADGSFLTGAWEAVDE